MDSRATTERQVESYYQLGHLEQAILAGLKAAGKDIDALIPSDLSAVDEFHLGWREATVQLASDLDLSPGQEMLDVGSGIGGPARYFAEVHGCRVHGIDLTEEFVQVATSLSRRCRLEERVAFTHASALAIPFADARFDAATLIHVGMNIDDKAKLFAEVRRVLRRGAPFVVYDIMRTGDGELAYPMPWAETAATSFVETVAAYRRLLEAQGFSIESEHNRRDATLERVRAMRAHAAEHGPPPLGLHVLMGATGPQRLGHAIRALEAGAIAPIQLLSRAH